jgi:hypothetical protein
MHTSTFLLLQDEGFLMQNCFKTSLTALRACRNEERGPYYGAFFNYTIGLERLLKVLLLMSDWHRNRQFPTDSELKKYGGRSGHDLQKLYESTKSLFQQYGVERESHLVPDDIDYRLLEFLSDFATRNRYFNLDMLTGTKARPDPLGIWDDLLLDVYEKDVPEQKRLPELDENDILVDHVEGNACVKTTGMGSTLQTQSEHNHEQGKMALALAEMCWRLVKLLAPLEALLIAIHERIREEDRRIDGEDTEASVPYMEAFLEDFVCEDRNIILESEDWP